MSDIEAHCLKTTPSVCSDGGQEAAIGVRSVSSITFTNHHLSKTKKTTLKMDEDSSFRSSLPGQQKPPHHHHKYNDDVDKDPQPLRRQPTHQWSFDMSEMASGDAVGFRISTIDVPQISAARAPQHYDIRKRLLPDDGQKEDKDGGNHPRKPRSKDRKRKKHRKNKERELETEASLGSPEDDTSTVRHNSDLAQVVKPVTSSEVKRNKPQRLKQPVSFLQETEDENPAIQKKENSERADYIVNNSNGQSKNSRGDGAAKSAVSALEKAVSEELNKAALPPSSSERNISKYLTGTVMSMTNELRQNLNQTFTAMFISQHIEQRECSSYVRNGKSDENDCFCGRPHQWHSDRGMKVNVNADRGIWHMKTHTGTAPCDSFGEIQFRGFGTETPNSPYVRVDAITEMEKVWMVLTDCWHLPYPKLLISVTGGAKRFYLRPRLKNMLKQGLVNAAVSTGAWLITGGTAAGVMEFVGEAVQDHIKVSGAKAKDCVALGIVSWGVVANNLALDGEGEQGLFPAEYCVEDITIGRGCVPLDPNHTHFILVDDGTERKFGGEIEFRAKLESYISEKVETGVTEQQSVNVPTVQLVVEGGINTLKTMRESIKLKIPVVVIDGSGRAADFMALAFRLTKSKTDEDKCEYPKGFEALMVAKARQMFEWRKEMSEDDKTKEINETIKVLRECLEHRKYINIFNLDKAESVKDIDRSILYALLKANKSNANSQLALALAWNRCDIAKEEIFTPENRYKWQQKDLYDTMFTALVQNRADFVQLFLDNGVDLKKFLTKETLWNLYCSCIRDDTSEEASLMKNLISYLKQSWGAFLLCRGTPDFDNFPDLLPHINRVITHLLEDQSFIFYSDKHKVNKATVGMKWIGDSEAVQPMSVRANSARNLPVKGRLRRRKTNMQENFCFERPERELFIWAILFNRRELSSLFWRLGLDHLGGALFAAAVLKHLAEWAEDEEAAELAKDMSEHSLEFERQAVAILSECYNNDKQQTHQLLIRNLNYWGGNTLFKMAENFQLMEFGEHSACQTKLSSIWKGRMAMYTSEMKIFVCALCPILVPFIKFTVIPQDKEGAENAQPELEDGTNNDHSSLMASPGRTSQNRNQVSPNRSALPDEDNDGRGFVRSKTRRKPKNMTSKFEQVNLFNFSTGNINIMLAIYYFYQAPVTKFFCNIVAYLVFLGLFSYFVLIKLSPVNGSQSPSVQEYITWGWCATMILEELRQIFIRDQHSLKFKFRSWFSNMWNRFDALMYCLFILSIILRYELPDSDFVGARVTYSITLAMFCLRFMQYFYAEKNMGPKVIMIRKMLTDLMFFFLILLVFMVSFGVAYHANLYPESPSSWWVLKNVVYFTYFQMHGENFLDTMEGDDVSGCTRNRTLWEKDPSKRCPQENAVVPVMLAIYMILTNILLVNLLIAMFSYTFQNVQENSTRVWRFYRLSLVSEYFDRPSLVPPIIIINHLFRICRRIYYSCTGSGSKSNAMKLTLEQKDQIPLTLFEKSAMECVLTFTKQQSKLTLDSRVRTTSKRLERVMEELEKIKDTLQRQEDGWASSGFQQASVSNEASEDLLQHERELMERNPLPVQDTGLEKDREEILQQKVEQVVSQSAAMAQRLSHMSDLLEKSFASQETLLRKLSHQQVFAGEEPDEDFDTTEA